MKRDDGSILLLAIAIFALAALRARQLPVKSTKKSETQLATLVPGFREAVGRVVAAMRAAGFDAVVREGVRSAARAQELAEKGTGIANSLHKIGLAADVISASMGWGAPEAFRQALRSFAEKEGLTSGAGFTNPDWAHIQAVAVAEQAAARAWSPLEREKRMRERYG